MLSSELWAAGGKAQNMGAGAGSPGQTCSPGWAGVGVEEAARARASGAGLMSGPGWGGTGLGAAVRSQARRPLSRKAEAGHHSQGELFMIKAVMSRMESCCQWGAGSARGSHTCPVPSRARTGNNLH